LFRRRVVRSQDDELQRDRQQLIIRSARGGRAHVVQLIGELRDIENAQRLQNELTRVEATDARQIIVDLSDLNSIDSDGLKTLINANTRSRRDRNRLILVHGPDHIYKIFETTGLISPLPFADDNQLQVAVVRQLSLAS
jgi:anti-anti-sigma factor